MTSQKQAQKLHTDEASLQDLGSASDWLKQISQMARKGGSYLWASATIKRFWINLGFRENAHLPLPSANINRYFSLRAK